MIYERAAVKSQGVIKKNLVYYTDSSGTTYPKGTLHSFLGIGYQECSDWDYIRVCDGYSTNLSNFYNWGWSDRDFKGMWYYAWD